MANKPNWHSKFPNSSDWNFNFYKLLKSSNPEENFIGRFTETSPNVAIVGAGIAGLLAARELVKAGCRRLTIYEASDRIGGRTYSIKAKGQNTTFEMGAMRIPFFSKPNSQNSIMDFFREEFNLETADFPTPGSNTCLTAIHINDNQEFVLWKGIDENFLVNVPNQIRAVMNKWKLFARAYKRIAKKLYNRKEWKPFWENVVKYYHAKDFRQLVVDEKNITEEYWKLLKNRKQRGNGLKIRNIENSFWQGNFGGLGLTNEEATLFFSIGAGDGGWGAFYDISSLYVIRTLLSGFGTNHKLVTKKNFSQDEIQRLDYLRNRSILLDSLDNELNIPNFLGVQSIAESLFYLPIKGTDKSLYELVQDESIEIKLFTSEVL